MLKAVLDTNLLISGIISRQGPPARIMKAWREQRFILISSLEILAEMERVFRYPRIADKYGIVDDDIDGILNLVKHEAVVAIDIPKLKVIKEDPADNKVLGTAVRGQAGHIVSGDRHLLELGDYQGISIINATRFLELLH